MRWRVILPLLSVTLNCGSLLNELERIRNKANATLPVAGATAPSVLYTIPADGTVSAPVQAYIDIVFDQPIDAATATGSSGNGTCTGTVLASYDEFQDCGGTPSVSGNTIRLSGGGTMPRGAAIKVKVTSGLKGTNGLAANPYQSVTGISFTTPCGQNCFYSDSAPMSAAIGAGSHSFIIPSGVKAGWILVVNGGGPNSTYWDPATNQTSIGPTLCGSVNNGGHSFEVKTLGGARSGKIITYIGGATGTACTYDPGTGNYSAGPALGGAAVNTGAMTIPILTGGNAGSYLLLDGSTVVSYLYNVGTDTFSSWAGATTAVGAGAYWYRLDTGPQSGNPFIVAGAGTTATTLYSEAGLSFSSPYTTAGPNGVGGFAFRVNSGTLVNKFLMANGAATTNTIGYDQNGGAVGGPTVPCAVSNGALTQAYTSGPRSGQTLILCGGASTQYTYYDHASNSFSPMFSGTGVIGSDASLTKISTGTHAGKYLLVNGNITGSTSMIDPAQDTFHGSRLFRATVPGLTAFAIKSGPKNGRVMILTGGTGSTIYDPKSGLTEMGPIAPVSLGTGANSLTITSGANTGKQFVFQGGGTSVVVLYDPNTNVFSTAAMGVDFFTAPGAKSVGSRHLLIPNGPQANNYLILNGGASTNADYFNTSTNTFTTGVSITGCPGGINAGSWILKITSGANAGKFIIVCGGALTTSIFDPAVASFAAGPSLGASPTAGAHGFYINSGVNSGKFIYIMASATSTRLYDPSGNTWAAGPALCASAGAGGFSIPVSAGANSGKTLVALGGGSAATCYYDPATSTFVAGPTTGGHNGYAIGGDSIAFATGGGMYPTAYFVAYGAVSTTFGHWFAY